MNDNITEINKDSFWKLIQSAKETCGQDMDAMMDFLKDRLVSMGPEQAQNFHDILHAYEDLADKFGLWDAAGVMKEYGCSDDGFIDFRAWLIAQGGTSICPHWQTRTLLRGSSPTGTAALRRSVMWEIMPMSSSQAKAPMTRRIGQGMKRCWQNWNRISSTKAVLNFPERDRS